jgi:hypothetical protein
MSTHSTFAWLVGLVFVGACVGSACGGKVILDVSADGAGGSTSSTGSVSTGTGTCDAKSHTIGMGGYDDSCVMPTDCIAVFMGNLCDGCSCGNAAINVADQSKYDAESAKKHQGVPPGGCFCPMTKVTCSQGTCVNLGT